MPDVFTKAKRSDVMSRIRSRENKDTEVALARVFRHEGITGWRRHLQLRVGELKAEGQRAQTFQRATPKYSQLSVRPNFVFPRLRLAVFVDGCFWHCCPLHATRPKGNAAFWRKKLATNQARDRRVNRELKRVGLRVLRLWEHELAIKNRSRLLRRLRRGLT